MIHHEFNNTSENLDLAAQEKFCGYDIALRKGRTMELFYLMLESTLPEHYKEEVIGDLHEIYYELMEQGKSVLECNCLIFKTGIEILIGILTAEFAAWLEKILLRVTILSVSMLLSLIMVSTTLLTIEKDNLLSNMRSTRYRC